MHLFHEMEERQIILVAKPGIYRQVPMYRRDRGLYAKHGTGFIRLYADGGTSMPTLRWDDMTLPIQDYHSDEHGRLQLSHG